MTGKEVKEKAKNILQKMRPMDYMIICALIFVILILGFIYFGKKVYAPTPVENEGKVSYTISSGNAEIPKSPFEVGAETFVTIRNIPHAKLKITDVQYNRKQVMMPTGSASNPYVLVDDKENPLTYDFLVTVEDTGKFTNDGVVSGGNKIKVGLPITLEAPLYKLNGIITNVEILTLKNNENE